MSFVKTYGFQFSVPTTPGGHTYSWKLGANWAYGVPIGNYGSPYVGAAIPGSRYFPGDVSLDDYGPGTIISIYRVNITTGAELELAPGSQLALNGSTIDAHGTTVYAANLMINQGTLLLDNDSGFELRSFENYNTNTGTFEFNGTDATIYLTRPIGESAYANVDDVAPTDKLILEGPHVSQGYTAWSAVDNGGTLQVFGTHAGTGTLVYQIDHFTTAAATTSFDVTQLTSGTDLIGQSLVGALQLEAVCFAAGTWIETDHGAVAVEALRTGDLVRTVARGDAAFKPVRWIGERAVRFTGNATDEALRPVRIRAGALGDDLPRRDLVVSGNHCLLLQGQLVPAKLLVNGTSIVIDRSADAIHYFHIELDTHDAVLAEGVPTESYIDVDNRAFFANASVTALAPVLPAAEDLAPWQDRLCAPLRVRAQDVDALWQTLAARGAMLGTSQPDPALTGDAAPSVVVSGRTVQPTTRSERSFTFMLPATAPELRILSRATVPAELDRHTNDWRRLGLCVSKIVLRSGTHQVVIPADHPALTRGWHPVEQDGPTCWRWTAGEALLTLPPSVRSGPLTVEIHTTGTMQYPLDQEPEQRAA